MPEHTPLDFPLDRAGTTFIEASAGTGKTHALTTLVARLVIEEGWSIDRILVVTFTRAATAELRDRIRRVLGLLLDAVRARLPDAVLAAGPEGPNGHGGCAGSPNRDASEPAIDPRAHEILAAWEDRAGDIDFALAARRLEGAVHDIDRANVFTIHGFCQRVLADLAFESGLSFGCEVGGEGAEVVAAAVRDFWRRRMHPSSTLLMRHAVESGFLPDALSDWMSRRRAKIGAEVVGGDPPAQPPEVSEADWRRVFAAVRSTWATHRDAFRAEVLEGPWLNRQRYRPTGTRSELDGLEALFAAPEPRLPAAGTAGRYGRERLSRACKRGFEVPDNPLFDAFDRLEEASRALRTAYDRWLRWARREALVEVRRSVRRRIRADRVFAWDDLLIELDDSLGSAGGERLAARIRREFPCALIDEYQDTDPVQARIFARIYGGSAESPPPAAAFGTANEDEDAPLPGRAPGSPGARAAAFEPANGGASARGERTRPGPFVVVGDPKQSIYRFRGADVFAYLAARGSATGYLHLGRNWRSVPPLVEAVNAMFSGADPFVTSGIEYRAVAAGGEPADTLRIASEDAAVPLELRLLPRARDGKVLAKRDVLPVVAEAAANEIARLLELGARGEAVIGDRALAGADLAVLVRTHEQGRLMAEALRERGVRSVEIDDGSVFHTREAEQLGRFLRVLAEPGREARIPGALAGDVFGLDAQALHALGEDERVWSAWAARRAHWRAHRESGGIGSVLLRLLEGEGGAQHLLRYPDGARRLTNYRHLAELLQAAEARERLAPAELVAWLARRRADPDSRDEEAKLRIESDERLVRILTVHGSKGLEFPVVFCPFAWDARTWRRTGGAVDAVYHRGAADGYREVIDLDPDGRAQAVERLEDFAESVRLFYVALTRAKHRCVVAWGQVHGAEHAPLAWLLHRPQGAGAAGSVSGDGSKDPPGAGEGDPGADGPDAVDGVDGPDAVDGVDGPDGPDAAVAALQAAVDRFLGLDANAWRGEVDAFARRVPGAVSVSMLDPEPLPVRASAQSDDPPPALAARALRRPLRRIRSLTSFSALWAEAASAPGGAGDRTPAGRDEAAIDRPDHDQHEEPADAAGDPPGAEGVSGVEGMAGVERAERVEGAPGAAGVTTGGRTAFTFPRGPVAGSCLHRIFERLDDVAAIAADRPGLDGICADALAEFGIDRVWRPVARDMVERTRAVVLGTPEPGRPRGSRAAGAGGFRLGDPHRRLVELEFHFPVEGLDRHRIASRLVEHGYPDPFTRAAPDGAGGVGEGAPPLDGYLRGYIDLVVEHARCWYVVDYKSNWLGPVPGDYGPEALRVAMHAGGYTLQSLIYLVALHRYLATRLPDYDCERHVGGAFYLFLRGIDPAAGMRRGVHFDRPSTECLLALDDCFRGGGT